MPHHLTAFLPLPSLAFAQSLPHLLALTQLAASFVPRWRAGSPPSSTPGLGFQPKSGLPLQLPFSSRLHLHHPQSPGPPSPRESGHFGLAGLPRWSIRASSSPRPGAGLRGVALATVTCWHCSTRRCGGRVACGRSAVRSTVPGVVVPCNLLHLEGGGQRGFAGKPQSETASKMGMALPKTLDFFFIKKIFF